jgi:hypothetical protein
MARDRADPDATKTAPRRKATAAAARDAMDPVRKARARAAADVTFVETTDAMSAASR